MEETQLKNTKRALALGLDVECGKLYAETFIDAVEMAGGVVRLYEGDPAYVSYEYLANAFVKDKDGYDDGYPKDPDMNVTLKLNGIYFEMKLDENCSAYIEKTSSSTFSVEKEYETEADFTVKPYQVNGKLVKAKPCEAKNFASVASAATARMHGSLYAIVNDRQAHEIKLLCKLTAADKADKALLESLETYGSYKVIKPWYWIVGLQSKYEQLHLGATWTISRGQDKHGNYVEFISPRWTSLM